VTLIDGPAESSQVGAGAEPYDGRVSFRARLSRVDWAYEIAFFVGVLAAAALALTLAGRRPGWSVGQTPPDPYLVQIYAAHFRHGDLFPVWSSSDAYGMGTPVPLFYQKAFFMVGGLVFIILDGALKATMIVTVAIFMVVGAYGMRKVLGVVTESRLLRTVGSIGFLLTNWVFAEWLVRADLAEFAALMVVPWLLFCCLTLVRDRRLSWLIVPVMVVLVDAHNAIAVISTFALVVTGVTFMVRYGLAGLQRIVRRILVSSALIALVLAPMVLAELKMAKFYDPAKVIIQENQAINSFTFPPPWQYFFDPSYRWLSSSNQSLPYQLDIGITLLLVVGLVTLFALRVRKSLRPTESELPRVNGPVVVVLVVSLAIYMFLQLRISLIIYKSFWQLQVIGYPYRMMAFALPLALILAIVVADWYLRLFRSRHSRRANWLPPTMAALWLASLVLLSPVIAHEPPPLAGFLPYAPFLPIQALTPPAHSSFRTNSTSPLFSDYLPIVDRGHGRPVQYEGPQYDFLHHHNIEAESLSSVPCTVVQTGGTAFESLRITYRVSCKGPTRLALPISYNPFTSIEEQRKGTPAHSVETIHERTDPRIIVNIGGAGPQTLIVNLPTLAGILF